MSLLQLIKWLNMILARFYYRFKVMTPLWLAILVISCCMIYLIFLKEWNNISAFKSQKKIHFSDYSESFNDYEKLLIAAESYCYHYNGNIEKILIKAQKKSNKLTLEVQ